MKHTLEVSHDSSPRWPLPVGVLTLLVLLLTSAVFLARQGTAAGQAPAPTPAAESSLDRHFIQGLRQALKDDRLSAADRKALEQKLAYSEQLANQRPAAPAGPRGPKGTLNAPVPMPQPLELSPTQPVERILPGSEGMVHSYEASIINMWEGLYNGIPTQVFAGAAPDGEAPGQVGLAPGRGLLILMKYPAENTQPTRQVYPAPTAAGSLRIIERQGSLLRCTTADGSDIFFNLETRAFQPQG